MFDAIQARADYQRRRNRANVAVQDPALRRAVFTRDNHTCVKCSSRDNLVISLVLSVYHGGETTENNLETLCKTCCYGKPL